MASRYDGLDPRTELEQRITADLKRALEKRGFEVEHQGRPTRNAAGNLPDIILRNGSYQINVEVTTTTKASSGREFLAVKDHLEKAKENHAQKKCFVIYSSPETHYRMINAMRDYNIAHKDDPDMKMLPLTFSSLQLFINKLIQNPAEVYPKKDIIALFNEYKLFVDDARILEVLRDKLFPDDEALNAQIEQEEQEKHGKTVENLVKDLLKLEQQLRDERGITHIDAIRTIIFLVFIKLYEEKREFENEENRFKKETFARFQSNVSDHATAIHKLFNYIKTDPDLTAAKVFTETDNFLDKLDDEFVIKFFIEPFAKYHFYTTRVDGIGAAYEILGRETGRDKAAGQFFTPENVVKFMVRLAELDTEDVVLDPACGTARFLIYSMNDMQKKAERARNAQQKREDIAKKQLFGSDYDPNVAKLAKMNMYIHGDGKSNIFDKDGLTLYNRTNPSSPTNMDGKVDIILSNPPLGDQSYQKSGFDDHFKLDRMEGIIPRINITEVEVEMQQKKLGSLQTQLRKAQEAQDQKKARRLDKSIKRCNAKISSLRNDLQEGRITWKATGHGMKGGALFLGAARHYLKPTRNANEPLEWRGGRLLVILDEGILNTGDYREVREFIKKHFFVKAIVSLSRDTFVPISATTTKTSILYAIKKDDPDVVQKEPIFFGHAEKVGVDTRSRVCSNHLFDTGNDILSHFFDFKKKVYVSYVGLTFNKERFRSAGFVSGTIV